MKIKIYALALLTLSTMVYSKCDKNNEDDDENIYLLETSYHGSLTLFYSNAFPAFSETTTIDADVDVNGNIVFGIGGMEYFGEDDNGQAKIRRQGELTIAPDGSYFLDEDVVHFNVNENTTVTETLTQWVWDDDAQEWIEIFSETTTQTWDGGLDFILEDAAFNGSIQEVSNENGTVRWTLLLTPELTPQ